MKGWDASSLGLVRKGPNRPDGRFTAVEFDGQIIWALDPKYFKPSVIEEITKPYRDRGITTTNDATIYVEDIDVKGFVTHSDSTNVTKEFLPVFANANVITGENPYDYSQRLENSQGSFELITPEWVEEIAIANNLFKAGEPIIEEVVNTVADFLNINFGLSPWKLNYHPSIFKDGEETTIKEIDIRHLDDIDLNSSSTITVNGADGATISYPLQNLLSSGNTKLKVKHVSDHLNGFWYILEFAGRHLQVKYDEQFIQKAIISDYVQHMLENSTREIVLAISNVYNTIIDMVNNFKYDSASEEIKKALDPANRPEDGSTPDLPSGSWNMNVFGVMNTMGDMLMEFGLRWAMFDDLKKSSSNVGGDFINDALGQQVDMLLTIDYPVENEMRLVNGTRIKGGQYTKNELRTFKVNTRFNGVDDMLGYVRSQFPGELVRINGELVFEYGRYNEYFNNLVRKGALIR